MLCVSVVCNLICVSPSLFDLWNLPNLESSNVAWNCYIRTYMYKFIFRSVMHGTFYLPSAFNF